MTVDVLVLPDADGAVRAWGRTLDLTTTHQGKVFFGWAKDAGDNQIVMRRVGGLPEANIDIDVARISFEVWGKTMELAALAARQLVAAVQGVSCGTRMGSDAVALGAQVTLGPLWRPDGEAGRARYLVDAVFTLRAAVSGQ